MKSPVKNIRAHIALWIWTSVIFLCSSDLVGHIFHRAFESIAYNSFAVSVPGGEGLRFFAQKLFHVFLFFTLGRLLTPLRYRNVTSKFLLCTAACFAIGTTSELLQTLTVYREATFRDVIINGLSGAISAALPMSTKSSA